MNRMQLVKSVENDCQLLKRRGWFTKEEAMSIERQMRRLINNLNDLTVENTDIKYYNKCANVKLKIKA